MLQQHTHIQRVSYTTAPPMLTKGKQFPTNSFQSNVENYILPRFFSIYIIYQITIKNSYDMYFLQKCFQTLLLYPLIFDDKYIFVYDRY